MINCRIDGKYFLIFTLIAGLLCGCTKKGPVLARVGNRKITIDEFREKLISVPGSYHGFLSTEGGQRQYLDGLIKEEVLVQRARREKLPRRPEIKKKLKDIESQVLLEAMIQELKKDRINVSDEEIKAYYNEHNQEFLNPEQVRASHILTRTKEEAEDVLGQLKVGKDFAELARKISADSVTGPRGGDVGYFGKGDMVPEFEKAVFALEKVGDITDVIKTQFGYHIAQLTGRRKIKEKTLEESEDEIRRIIQRKKFDQLLDYYYDDFEVRIYAEQLPLKMDFSSEEEAENREEDKDE